MSDVGGNRWNSLLLNTCDFCLQVHEKVDRRHLEKYGLFWTGLCVCIVVLIVADQADLSKFLRPNVSDKLKFTGSDWRIKLYPSAANEDIAFKG